MLTLKKLGLMTVAAMTAFTISCSDDDKNEGDSSSSGGSTEAYWTFTLSNAGKSWADVDGKETYKSADVNGSTATAKKIDIVAYHTGPSAGDKIYSGGLIEVSQDGYARIFNTKASLCAAIEDNENDGEASIAASVGKTIYLESTELALFSVEVKALGDASMDLEANIITCP